MSKLIDLFYEICKEWWNSGNTYVEGDVFNEYSVPYYRLILYFLGEEGI